MLYLWLVVPIVLSLILIDWGRLLQHIYHRWLAVIALGVWVWQVAIPFVQKHPFNPPMNNVGPFMQKWGLTFLHNQYDLIITLTVAACYIVAVISRGFYPLDPVFNRLSSLQRLITRHKLLSADNMYESAAVPFQPTLEPVSAPSGGFNIDDFWRRMKEQDAAKRRARVMQNMQGERVATPTAAPDPESLRMNGKVGRQRLGQRFPVDPSAMKAIIGMEEPLEAIQTAIEIPLKAPKVAQKYNYDGFSGIILHGPPGNGKTKLARAVAESLGLYFINIQPSSVMGTLVGATEQHIRNAFLEARENAPAVIFFDEIDAIAKRRGSSPNTGHLDTALNELLIALDGFESRKCVFVMAATNRLDIIDPAILRPGRFDKKIYVPNPSEEARALMFWTWTQGLPLSDTVYPREIALLTEGASGADIRGWTEKIKELVVNKAYKHQPELITRNEVLAIIQKDRS